VLSEDIDLLFEIFDISAEFLLFGCEDDIAAAEVAGRSAKGEMDIEREFLFSFVKIF
jgi:hypothetical protein